MEGRVRDGGKKSEGGGWEKGVGWVEEDCAEMIRAPIEARRAVWQEVPGKRRKVANKHQSILPCSSPFRDNKSLRSIVTSIIRCQNVYLPVADKRRTEGKFAVGVIFRCVLICRIYLQLAFAAPSNTAGGVGE